MQKKMETVVGLYGECDHVLESITKKLQIGQTEIIKRCLLRYRFIFYFLYICYGIL